MDFARVLDALLECFERDKIRYAAMGGISLGLLGVPRATMDIDFLVHREDIERLDAVMRQLGYERFFHSDDVSQYRHRNHVWGGIDFLHAFRQISLAMLERAQPIGGKGTIRSIRVLQPEDVIGLKVQAMTNDPERKEKEDVDIQALMGYYRQRLNWDRIGEYFRLFGFQKEFENLKGRFAHAE